jgi:hypothetical protein
MEALTEAMKSNSVNEQQALVQLDKVLGVEREIKRLHISMGVRIKNKLTPEQQAKLQAMRIPPPPPDAPGRVPDNPVHPPGTPEGPES